MDEFRRTTQLAASLLRFGYPIRFRASGWSMKPLLRSGCLLRIAPLREDPRIGDIVLFRTTDNRLVSHRVVKGSAGSIWTKGDACSQVDPVVGLSQILGKVMAVEKPLYIPLSGWGARWIGRALSRFYPKLVRLKMNIRHPRSNAFRG